MIKNKDVDLLGMKSEDRRKENLKIYVTHTFTEMILPSGCRSTILDRPLVIR